MKKAKTSHKNSKKALNLSSFLDRYRVEKGNQHTHTCMGNPSVGSFEIPDEELDLFYKLYEKDYLIGKKLSLIEKHNEVGPILIDIDMKYEIESKKNESGEDITDNNGNSIPILKRYYDQDLVKKIVQLYMNEIVNVFQLTSKTEQLIALIFERNKPYCYKNEVKDGIHIIFPYIISEPSIQYVIRDNVIKKAEGMFDHLPLKNDNLYDIFDRSVIEKNGWFMYGSSKPYCQPYELNKIYDYQMNVLKTDELNYQGIDNLAKFLSIRRYQRRHCTPIQKNAEQDIEKILKKKKAYTKSRLVRKGPSNNNYDVKTIAKMVDILSLERCEKYEPWIELGWCLHNIDPTNVDLLNIWIDFSKKTRKGNFKEGICEKEWEKSQDKGLGIGSLHHWAKLDDYEGYMAIKREDIRYYIEKSINNTNYDIAKVLHVMFKEHYVCCSTTNNKWYEFRDHRWRETEGGIDLRKKISLELVKEYTMEMSRYNNMTSVEEHEVDEFVPMTDEEEEECHEKGKMLYKISLNLRQTSFKENVMKESRELFYNVDFYDKLNENHYLIGFENGVFDLKNYKFRDGRPEDYITFSTGNNYIEFSHDDEVVLKIKAFMESLFPQEHIREYMYLVLASTLQGYNAEQKFRIWTGCHAKDTLIMMADGSKKKVQDIQLGEQLMGDDSTPRNVLKLIRNRGQMCRIVPIKGEPFVVNEDHILCLKATTIHSLVWLEPRMCFQYKWHEKDSHGYPIELTKRFLVDHSKRHVYHKDCVYYCSKGEANEEAQEFIKQISSKYNFIKNGDVIEIPVKEYLKRKTIMNKNYYGYRVAIEYPEKNVEFDPYMLGYWIGDGHSNGSSITTMDEEIVEYFEEKCTALGLTTRKQQKKDNKASTYHYNGTKYGKRDMNVFSGFLKNNNLINNKHIPEEYLHNSRDVRMQVLAGIIDSDGHYQKHTNQYEICMKSEKIMDDIIDLSRSLGFAAYKKKISKTCTNAPNGPVEGTYYRTQIVGNGIEDIPVKLLRKQASPRIKNKDVLRYGFKVEMLEEDDYYGFTLDGNSRYVLADHSVTHNCGSNGKSLLNKLMQYSYGEYCNKFPIQLFTQKRGKSNAASPEVVEAKGKRYAYMEETSENENINIGMMKEYTGNDQVKGRGLFEKKIVTFIPQWKLFLFCNDLPYMPAHEGGTWRRVEANEFGSKFVDNPKEPNEFPIDRQLPEKINEWKEAFMWLLIQYYAKYKENGIKVPEEVIAFTKEYEKEGDKYAEFISKYMERTGNLNDVVEVDELYDEFKFWHGESCGGFKTPSKRDFKKYLERALGRKYISMTVIKGYQLKRKDALKLKVEGFDDIEAGMSKFTQDVETPFEANITKIKIQK